MKVTHSNARAEADISDYCPLRIADDHLPYIGNLAKPGPLYVALATKYRELFNAGESRYQAESLYFACHNGGPYEIALIFIDEPPMMRGNLTWFCLEEIGEGCLGDWHWLTLDQLVLCE